MKIYEKTDPELSESHRTRMAKYVAAHKEVGTRPDDAFIETEFMFGLYLRPLC